jgi:DNA-binding transcriptional LysR family regulator
VVDLVHEGFDLAIRLGPLEESRLVARELGVLEYGLFACPHYLERHGTPRSLDELKQHSLLMFSAGSHRKGWQLYPEGDAQRAAEPERIEGPARLRVNNSFAARDATLRSLGVSVLPYLVAGEWVAAGRLRPVLPEWRPRPVAVNAVFPSNRYLSPKVRAMIDLALERFPDDTLTARRQALASCELPS